jgi:hypothetical protein
MKTPMPDFFCRCGHTFEEHGPAGCEHISDIPDLVQGAICPCPMTRFGFHDEEEEDGAGGRA